MIQQDNWSYDPASDGPRDCNSKEHALVAFVKEELILSSEKRSKFIDTILRRE